MKNKPTLEEVKEYFKNADKIKCLSDGKEISLLSTLRRGMHLWCSAYWVDLDPMDNAKIWDSNKGYAEILTCKEKTFAITESQIKGLSEEIKISPESAILYLKEKLFPEAFKSEVKMEVGKWYKKLNFGKFMFCFNGKIEYCYQYGFNYVGEWSEQLGIDEELMVSYVEATKSEVFEALKNEAVKRGLVDGVYYLSVLNKTPHCHHLHFDDLYFHYKSNYLSDGRGSEIFQDGKWAEPIEAITKSEAEKQLNKKIID